MSTSRNKEMKKMRKKTNKKYLKQDVFAERTDFIFAARFFGQQQLEDGQPDL